jgi:hypothetical protein
MLGYEEVIQFRNHGLGPSLTIVKGTQIACLEGKKTLCLRIEQEVVRIIVTYPRKAHEQGPVT